MTEQEALSIVDRLITALQRYRSMASEELPEDIRKIGSVLQEHTLGEAEFLETLIKIQDRGTINPLDLYNITTMSHRIAPEAAVAYDVIHYPHKLPEPDSSWLSGWKG